MSPQKAVFMPVGRWSKKTFKALGIQGADLRKSPFEKHVSGLARRAERLCLAKFKVSKSVFFHRGTEHRSKRLSNRNRP